MVGKHKYSSLICIAYAIVIKCKIVFDNNDCNKLPTIIR